MNCRKIFNRSQALIAEDPYDENNNDLQVRSIDVINTFIQTLYDVSNLYEVRVLKLPEPEYIEISDIDDNFPLCNDMAVACIYYLASVLINNENSELSDKLLREYKLIINDIMLKIPAEIEKISDFYN